MDARGERASRDSSCDRGRRSGGTDRTDCGRTLRLPAGYVRASASFGRIGGAVGIQNNGLRVLDALGLLDRFESTFAIAAGLRADAGIEQAAARYENAMKLTAGYNPLEREFIRPTGPRVMV